MPPHFKETLSLSAKIHQCPVSPFLVRGSDTCAICQLHYSRVSVEIGARFHPGLSMQQPAQVCLLWALPLDAAPISPLQTPPSSPATGPPNRLVDLTMFCQGGSLGVSFGGAIGLDPCQTVNAWRQEWRLYPHSLPTLPPPPPPPGRAGCLHVVRVSQCVLTHPLQLMT